MEQRAKEANAEVHRLSAVLDGRVERDREVRAKRREFNRMQENLATVQATAAKLERLVKQQGDALIRLPDAAERLAVEKMGFFSRLRWSLGVAFTGKFRWQREAADS